MSHQNNLFAQRSATLKWPVLEDSGLTRDEEWHQWRVSAESARHDPSGLPAFTWTLHQQQLPLPSPGMNGILLDILVPLYTFSLPTGENGVTDSDAGVRWVYLLLSILSFQQRRNQLHQMTSVLGFGGQMSGWGNLLDEDAHTHTNALTHPRHRFCPCANIGTAAAIIYIINISLQRQ